MFTEAEVAAAVGELFDTGRIEIRKGWKFARAVKYRVQSNTLRAVDIFEYESGSLLAVVQASRAL